MIQQSVHYGDSQSTNSFMLTKEDGIEWKINSNQFILSLESIRGKIVHCKKSNNEGTPKTCHHAVQELCPKPFQFTWL